MRRRVMSVSLILCALLAGCGEDRAPTQQELAHLLERYSARRVDLINHFNCERAQTGRYLCSYDVSYIGYFAETDSACYSRVGDNWRPIDLQACIYDDAG